MTIRDRAGELFDREFRAAGWTDRDFDSYNGWTLREAVTSIAEDGEEAAVRRILSMCGAGPGQLDPGTGEITDPALDRCMEVIRDARQNQPRNGGNMTGMPRRFELGEPFRASQTSPEGTIIVRRAIAYGYGAKFRSPSPCCARGSLIDAALWAGTGQHVTCNGCGWKWDVYLAAPDGIRLPQQARDAAHPQIHCDRAEWVSRGFGKRPYNKKKT